MAKDNPSWGYDRIAGAMKNLGHRISDQTVGNILKRNGIAPSDEQEEEHFVGQLHQATQGRAVGNRLPYYRNLDQPWSDHVLCSVLHSAFNPTSSSGWHHGITERAVDEAGSQKRLRLGRRDEGSRVSATDQLRPHTAIAASSGRNFRLRRCTATSERPRKVTSITNHTRR